MSKGNKNNGISGWLSKNVLTLLLIPVMLTALWKMYDALDSKLDTVNEAIGRRVTELNDATNTRLSEWMARVEEDFEDIGEDIDDVASDLEDLDARVAENSDRIDGIVDGLYEEGIRIMYEEVTGRVSNALVTTLPYQTDSGGSSFAVHLIDLTEQTRATYVFTENHPYEEWIALIIGDVLESDVEGLSFSQLEQWSLEIERPVLTPAFVNGDASFVFRIRPTESITNTVAANASVEIAHIEYMSPDWGELVDVLEQHPDDYRPGFRPD